MTGWLARVAELVAAEGCAARIAIIAARGPTPREVGAAVLVTASRREGKIGRGALETAAVARARSLLVEVAGSAAGPRWLREIHEVSTGPVLGASSDGVITILIEVFGPAEIAHLHSERATTGDDPMLVRPLLGGGRASVVGSPVAAPEFPKDDRPTAVAAAQAQLSGEPARRQLLVEADGQRWLLERLGPRAVPFYVYGTGLVARALVEKLAGLPFDVVWVDTDAARLAGPLPGHVTALTSPDPVTVARGAAAGSFHVVMTQSHELDFSIAKALLEAGSFGHLGVIGSRMKRKRLEAMLERDGIPSAAQARLVCPVGLPGIKSKAPAVIAVAIAAQALIALRTNETVDA